MPLQLCYITDRRQLAASADEATRQGLLLRKIEEAAAAGVEWIQLREKDLSSRALEALAKQAVAIVRAARTAGSSTRLLLNSRLDVALALGADGVHLTSRGLTFTEVRRVLQQFHEMSLTGSPPTSSDFDISASCHTVEEVTSAAAAGASLVVFGPVFGKVDAPRILSAGLDQLHQAVTAAGSIPVFALGGVTLSNAASCLQAGATGIAGIRLFQQTDIAATAATLRAQFRSD